MFADSGFSSSSAKCVKEPTMCVWFLANFRCFAHMVLGTQINIIFRKTKTNCANKWCDSCSNLLQFQRKHADACDNSAGVHIHARTDCRKTRRPTVFEISNNATTPIEITNEIPPGSRTWSISFGQYIEVPWSVCHLQCCRGMVENNGLMTLPNKLATHFGTCCANAPYGIDNTLNEIHEAQLNIRLLENSLCNQQLFRLARSYTIIGIYHGYRWTVHRLSWMLIDKKEGKLKKNSFLKISFGFFRIATPSSEISFWLKTEKAKNKGLFTI